jgi:hypothetical protein
MSFATANVVSMNALGSCTPFPQRTIRPRHMRRSLMVRAEQQQQDQKPQMLRDEVRGAPGVQVPDKGEKDSYE